MGDELNRAGVIGMRWRMTQGKDHHAKNVKITAQTNLEPTEADISKGVELISARSFDDGIKLSDSALEWYTNQRATQNAQRELQKSARDSGQQAAAYERWVANGRQQPQGAAPRPSAPPALRQPGGAIPPGGRWVGEHVMKQNVPGTAGQAEAEGGVHLDTRKAH